MSLVGKKLYVIDTMEVLVRDVATGVPILRGNTTKANVSNKNDKIEVVAGIGQERECILYTKKTTDIEFVVTGIDLEFMARQNGIALDIASKGAYFVDRNVLVTTAAAVIEGATRIIAVKDTDGKFFKIVTTDPLAGEVKVAGTGLTFVTGYAGTSCYVTYEGVTAKDNLTINFNSKTFPKNVEFIGHTIAYDKATEVVVADANINYYLCSLDGDYDWTFEMGKSFDTTVKLGVLVPDFLPSGAINSTRDTGKFVITERG